MGNKIGIDTILIILAIIIVGGALILTLSGDSKTNGGQEPSLSQAIERANDKDLLVFNTKFTGYAGSQRGVVLKGLKTVIDNNNSSNERKVTLVGGDDLQDDSMYTVSFNYDSDGYVSTVTIK